jgi:hypothetical protein
VEACSKVWGEEAEKKDLMNWYRSNGCQVEHQDKEE